MAFAAILGRPKTRQEVFASVRQIPVAAGFALALLLSNLVLGFLPVSAQLAVFHATSTNITHLAVDPLFVLPASAFVDTETSWLWVPLSLVLIGALERRFGSMRAFFVVFGAHVLATLIAESVLLTQVVRHVTPRSSIDIIDVGPSYVILAALAGCLAVGSRNLRIFAFITGALIVPNLLIDLPQLDMASIGHLFALLLGAGFALSCTKLAGWARTTKREAVKVASTAGALAADVAAPVLHAVNTPAASQASS